jgi:hypothetical protein
VLWKVAYPGVANAFAMLRLLPRTDRDKVRVRNGKVGPGDTVAVVGSGPIGSAAITRSFELDQMAEACTTSSPERPTQARSKSSSASPCTML